MIGDVSGEARTVFVVNPGSTSTKLALYESAAPRNSNLEEIVSEVLPSARATSLEMDLEARASAIYEYVDRIDRIDCVAARGGLVRPVSAGSYFVNDSMIDDLISCRYGRHASNLGAPLAKALAERFGCRAIIADPVAVDGFTEVARFSGIEGIVRKSFSHALNLRAVARRAASDIGKGFSECRFVGVHLGGGISVAAIVGGRIVDVNDSSEGGPFTPQRTGGLPVLQLVDLCFSGEFRSAEELKAKLNGAGGLSSYLGTSSVIEALQRAASGDTRAKLVVDAMVYQIVKEIGATAAVLDGNLDAVFLTGGFARDPISQTIGDRINWIGPVLIYPGEGEMLALAEAAFRYIRGEETPFEY